MYTKAEFEVCYRTHFQMVWNLCYTYLRHPADTEDAVQETFLRLARRGKSFRNREHEKAWLIVTAGNVCKDELKRKGRNTIGLEAAGQLAAPRMREDGTLLALKSLPEHYRTVLYLYYYEGWSTKQIGKLLRKPDATIRSQLHRGRNLLKTELEGML